MFTQVTERYPKPSIYPATPETPTLSITFGTLSACKSFEMKDYRASSHCFYRISLCSPVYMYVLAGICCYSSQEGIGTLTVFSIDTPFESYC